MKPQGSSINKQGSKYSPAPIIYNRALFKTGVNDFFLSFTKAISGYYFCSRQKIVPQKSTKIIL